MQNDTTLKIQLVSGERYTIASQEWTKVSYGEDFIRIYQGEKRLLFVFVTRNVEYIEYLD